MKWNATPITYGKFVILRIYVPYIYLECKAIFSKTNEEFL